jgi:hypothetical protein
MRRKEAEAISNLKFQISNEMQRQSRVKDKSKKRNKKTVGIPGERRDQMSLADEKAAASRPSTPLRTSCTSYGICCDLHCGFYGAGGGAGGA